MSAVRPATAADAGWLATAFTADWGGDVMVLDGVERPLRGRPVLVADPEAGYLVHEDLGGVTEILALAVREPHRGRGLGRSLVDALPGHLLAVTTNDNLGALGFYQRLGFRPTGVRLGAVDRSRAVKPQIPLVGEGGIPIHDEFVLERPAR